MSEKRCPDCARYQPVPGCRDFINHSDAENCDCWVAFEREPDRLSALAAIVPELVEALETTVNDYDMVDDEINRADLQYMRPAKNALAKARALLAQEANHGE